MGHCTHVYRLGLNNNASGQRNNGPLNDSEPNLWDKIQCLTCLIEKWYPIAYKTSQTSYERHNQVLMYSFQTINATIPRQALTSYQKRMKCEFCRFIKSYELPARAYAQTLNIDIFLCWKLTKRYNFDIFQYWKHFVVNTFAIWTV